MRAGPAVNFSAAEDGDHERGEPGVSDLVQIGLQHRLPGGDALPFPDQRGEAPAVEGKGIDARKQEDLHIVVRPEGDRVAGVGDLRNHAGAG